MTDQIPAQKRVERPFEVGACVRYWPTGHDRYIPVTVVGYTKGGRVRIRYPANAAGYVMTGAVKPTSLSEL